MKAIPGWLLLVLLGALALVPTPQTREQQARAVRVLTYPLTDHPVRFSLEPGETEIKILTWVSVPRGRLMGPRQTEPYAIEARILNEQRQEVWSQQVWIRTRASRVDSNKGIGPATTRTSPSLQVSDDTHTRLQIPPNIGNRAILEVTAPFKSDNTEVLGIVFRRGNRGAVEQARLQLGGAKEFRDRSADRIGVASWQALPYAWRERLSEQRWERLGSLPDTQGATPTIPVFTTWQKTPYDDGPLLGLPIYPGQSVAYNLQGPLVLTARWTQEDGITPLPTAARMTIVRQDGSTETQVLPRSEQVGPLTFKEEVFSVSFAPLTHNPTPWIRARVLGGSAWGQPSTAQGEGGWWWVAPELVRRVGYRLDRGQDPLEMPLAPAEVIRVEVTHPITEATGSVTVQTWSKDGVPNDQATLLLSPDPNPFARYAENEQPASPVSHPQRLFVQAPAEGGRVSFVSDAPADVLVKRRQPWQMQQRVDDYVLPDPTGVRGHNTPSAMALWQRKAALDHEQLAEAGRIVSYDDQARLVPINPDDLPATMHTLTVGEPYSVLVEPDRDGIASAGARTQLTSTSSGIQVAPSGRLTVDYRIAKHNVGSPVLVSIDGDRKLVDLFSSIGSFRLRAPPGRRSIQIEGEGLFFARAPGGRLWQSRQVKRTTEEQPWVIDVPSGRQTLAVYGYSRGVEQLRMYWQFEGQTTQNRIAPELMADVTGSRDLDPLGSALPLSFTGERLTAFRPLILQIPDGPPRQLAITAEGGSEVYLRAMSTWGVLEAATEGGFVLRETP